MKWHDMKWVNDWMNGWMNEWNEWNEFNDWMTCNEMTWNEVKWNEMKWNAMNMTWHEIDEWMTWMTWICPCVTVSIYVLCFTLLHHACHLCVYLSLCATCRVSDGDSPKRKTSQELSTASNQLHNSKCLHFLRSSERTIEYTHTRIDR